MKEAAMLESAQSVPVVVLHSVETIDIHQQEDQGHVTKDEDENRPQSKQSP